MDRAELVTRAEAELGKTNWRPYLNFCGIDFKTDWCMAFVSWAFGDLNGRAIPNKLINVPPVVIITEFMKLLGKRASLAILAKPSELNPLGQRITSPLLTAYGSEIAAMNTK